MPIIGGSIVPVSDRPLALAGIPLMLTHPGQQRLRRAADLGGDGFNRRPLRRMIAATLGNHAHGALTNFGEELYGLLHGSIFSRSRASTKPGAIQNAKSYGMKMPRLGTEDGRLACFPLPPLAEQHRIVAKIDELMALCDRLETEQTDAEAGHARLVENLLGTLPQSTDADEFAANWQRLAEHFDHLFVTEASIDALRQTVLKLAVMGKLVPQDEDDETAIDPIRAARLQAELPSRAADLPDGDNDKLFDLPASWIWVTVSDVAESRLGKMLDKGKNRGEAHPYLRNTNVHWFRFQLDSIKTMLFDQSEITEYLVEPGDVLICEGGHGIGRSAVWSGQIPGIMFQKALHRVRPLPRLNGHFLTFCLRVYEHAGILQRYYTGAGIPHFTGKALAQLILPLPPVAEQHRIVAKVEELMELCDRLTADLVDARSRQARLADSLIDAALEAA